MSARLTSCIVALAVAAPLVAPVASGQMPAPFEEPPIELDDDEEHEARFFEKDFPVYSIPTPEEDGLAPTSVIGEVATYRIQKGDTLMDLARLYSLGYNEMVEANPGIDPWVPQVGATILLPTQWVLPCCDYRGVVVNIPEMRLFYMWHDPDDPARTLVQTYPVGLGRDDWRTPKGKFKIAGKTTNPQWNIPESIRQEHIREKNDHRYFIPGGAPDNPLGKHRLELTLPLYRIHGTNIPWGVGMQVSHGCIRLYPEDIATLFPTVPVGAPGEFAYQAVKIGVKDDAVYIQSHSDIYGYSPARYRETVAELERLGVLNAVDEALLMEVLTSGRGIPMRVSPGGAPGAPLVRFDLLEDEAEGS